ncbi:hypothetical protein IRP63_13925 (plasmid) [Clostridium botulinum]|uniref:Uncharacterized protein n=1 Tax=Clostridium botulinum C/D str. DC5 TaxID=1443128 RepID=A0A0A0ILP8_CLOBO|nr:hypothetical protein [Clostridium botulinum]KGN01549.1 hypothetical protein Z955_01120 [Clostridium botulinum C/D str. DC5]KOC56903.1 hypothetical protein ADU89_01540 [Clostridium botulinum]KOC57378.1 hypothetical protein ADU90_06080 [Clostridium botulinum]MCD3232614.1 hypothetical protein [Clostridium botulinum D/C]MCD3238457.1 hypothetical protein [Clostridium botulinum D/C]
MKIAFKIISRNFLILMISLLIVYTVFRLYSYVDNLKFSVAFIGGAIGSVIVDNINIVSK